jgi:hypothetical protein
MLLAPAIAACALLTPAQVATVRGLSPNCSASPPARGPGSTSYTANWPGKSPKAPSLTLTVVVYTDSRGLRQATQYLKVGGVTGRVRKVTGIGTAAYVSSGDYGAAVHFVVGRSVAYLTLSVDPGARPPPVATVEAFARAIARRL